MKLRRVFSIVLPIILLLAGWFGHGFYDSRVKDRSMEIVQVRPDTSDYKFINPLILVADTRDLHFEKYDDLKSKVKSYISKSLSNGRADKISFYLRDLDGSEWIGVNEEEKYAPASMLKVGTLMAVLKLADKDPKILLNKSYYEATETNNQYYKPRQLAPGYYTVKQLLEQMVHESDNDAMRALHKLYANELVEIYEDLNLPDPFSDSEPIDFISPREYSRFFRTFYNGAYISHLYSDEALGLLTQTNFKDGLVAGIPTSTAVAHKFGEYNDPAGKQLHDCGIVYQPGKPYFICVMTKGGDYAVLANIIKDISKIVYEEINNQK
jgi:beta-lactamase class A